MFHYKNEQSTYQEIEPSKELKNFIHSFWTHTNHKDRLEKITIFPDSYFKIVFVVKNNKIITYFMTGLWLEEKIISIPSKATTYGCRLKILAPEFLLNREVTSVIQNYSQLNLEFLNVNKFDLSSFEVIVNQWQNEFMSMISSKPIQGNKLRLSQLLDKMKGDISASEVSSQIYWANRQINRYLNKYIGVSLKKYLNIQKCYESYIQIREGSFFPEKGFFDQAHFIREIKKHTGETPTSLHKHKNDRFIQLKRITKK